MYFYPFVGIVLVPPVPVTALPSYTLPLAVSTSSVGSMKVLYA
jgi:hypothetical protein